MGAWRSDRRSLPTASTHPLEPLVGALARSLFAAEGDGLAAWDAVADELRTRFPRRARETLHEIDAAGYQVSRAAGTAVEPQHPGSMPGDSVDLEQNRHEAERFLRSGEPLLAYNVVQQALEAWPTDLRLRQLQSLALSLPARKKMRATADLRRPVPKY